MPIDGGRTSPGFADVARTTRAPGEPQFRQITEPGAR